MIIQKAYYRSTKHIPRRLPRSQPEFFKLQWILTQFFGLDDDPSTWMTVCGQITSTPPTKMRKPLSSIANAALRLQVNLVAHNQKLLAGKQIEDKLKTAIQKVTANEEEVQGRTILPVGAPDL